MDAIHLPGVTLPTTLGQPALALPPGQLIQALVLELLQSNVFRLQLPQAIVDVRSDVPLKPGSTVTLAAKGTAPNTRLVIYADAPQAAGQGAPPPGPAGRQPIGEAVIIARAPASTPNRIAEPPVPDAPSITPARQPEAPARAMSPERALGDAVRAAASRQSGMAPLLADVEQVATLPALPAPVRAAVADVLSLRVPLDEKLTAADVKQAFVRSGVLFEPRVAAARIAPPTDADIPAPAPSSDLKAALLVLRHVAKIWSASEPAPSRAIASAPPITAGASDMALRPPPVPASDAIKHVANALAGLPNELIPQNAPLSPEQATSLAKTLASVLETRDAMPASRDTGGNGALSPPYRGAPLAAQPPAAPSIMPDAAPHEIADKLIAHTEGALARTTLLQAASLPDQPQSAQRTDAGQRWSFEVPFATPQGTAIAQFEVSRDARAPKADPQAATWRARFSLDVEPMGPVHALIALNGARTSVTLWAERHATAARLNDQAATLSEALRAAELEPAGLQLRVGAPPALAKQAAPGRFMDRAT